MVIDRCLKRWFFEEPYKVTIGVWSEWKEDSHELNTQGLVWFTDRSKTEKGVRAVT